MSEIGGHDRQLRNIRHLYNLLDKVGARFDPLGVCVVVSHQVGVTVARYLGKR